MRVNLYRNLGDLDFGLGGGIKDNEPAKTPEVIEAERIAKEQADADAVAAAAEAERLRLEAEGGGGNPGGNPAGNPGGSEKEEEEEEEVTSFVMGTLVGTFGNPYEEGKGPIAEGEEESLDTVVKYFNDVKPLIKQEGVQELFEELPAVASLFNHLKEGKAVGSWLAKQNSVDYTKIKLDDKTEDSVLISIIREDLVETGVSKDDAELMITAVGDAGKTLERAKLAISNRNARQAKQLQAQEFAEIQANKNAELEAQKEIDAISSVIKTGKLVAKSIPPTEQKAFLDYVLKPVTNEGYTQRDIDHASLSYEQLLYIDSIVKDLKSGAIKSVPAAVKNAQTLADLSKKNKVAKTDSTGNQVKKMTLGDVALSLDPSRS